VLIIFQIIKIVVRLASKGDVMFSFKRMVNNK
jgi:lipopolysaccharide/colanic/teichoic acid biosynthesis glycosyltransferase